jgi:hypothetical protein
MCQRSDLERAGRENVERRSQFPRLVCVLNNNNSAASKISSSPWQQHTVPDALFHREYKQTALSVYKPDKSLVGRTRTTSAHSKAQHSKLKTRWRGASSVKQVVRSDDVVVFDLSPVSTMPIWRRDFSTKLCPAWTSCDVVEIMHHLAHDPDAIRRSCTVSS